MKLASRLLPLVCLLVCFVVFAPSHRDSQGNPFRETGPPANMAKLILLRHKVRLLTWYPTQLLTHPSRFKRATGSDVAPHIHDKHHEHTLYLRLAQKHPGCASGNHLGENSITDTAITLGPLLPCRHCFTIPNIPTFYGSVTPTITCFVATPLLVIQG